MSSSAERIRAFEVKTAVILDFLNSETFSKSEMKTLFQVENIGQPTRAQLNLKLSELGAGAVKVDREVCQIAPAGLAKRIWLLLV
jgi:hypothetical protein